MKVDVLDALLASAVLYGVGSYLFWVDKTIITWTADAVFGTFKRQGAHDERRRRMEEEVKEDKKSDEDFAKLVPAARFECPDFEPPPMQVIDDVGKK